MCSRLAYNFLPFRVIRNNIIFGVLTRNLCIHFFREFNSFPRSRVGMHTSLPLATNRQQPRRAHVISGTRIAPVSCFINIASSLVPTLLRGNAYLATTHDKPPTTPSCPCNLWHSNNASEPPHLSFPRSRVGMHIELTLLLMITKPSKSPHRDVIKSSQECEVNRSSDKLLPFVCNMM